MAKAYQRHDDSSPIGFRRLAPPAVGEPGVSERLAYRPEIDGMRAIAVAAVVLYHAGAAGFRGGFVGVDIFFVISGFLITSLIRKHVEAEGFSFTEFYERRVRRILPAFIVMLAFCCLVAPFVLLPEDLRQFFDSALASVLFVSNILFAREYDYFGQVPIYNPLLHVWSLSVEEQFYIALPLLLVVVHRLRRWSATIVVSALAIASFVLSIWMVRHRPEVAFYVAPTRAWELLLGSLLALGAFPRLRHQHVRTFVAATGLALIVGSIALLSEYHSFPGANALYPCLGAALIIHAETGATSPVGRLLQRRPLRALGLISYSLYLWHWPLLVFAKYYIIRELHWLETVGIVAASVVAAGLSWHFIEKPFRAAGAVLPQARLFAATGSLIAAFALFGLVNGTLVSPFGGSAVAQTTDSRRHAYRNVDFDRCLAGLRTRQSRTVEDVVARSLCRLGDPAAPAPTFALWGDSHAEAIRAGVEASAKAHNVSGYFMGHIDCPPAVGIEVYETGEENGCLAFNQAVMQLLHDPVITTVILHARWAREFWGTPYQGELGVKPLVISSAGQQGNKKALTDGVRSAIEQLTDLGKRVYIVAGVPEIGIDVPNFLSRSQYLHRDVSIGVSFAEYVDRNGDVNMMLENIARRLGATILFPNAILCDKVSCLTSLGSEPIYYDDDHLSRFGALLLEPMLDRVFVMHSAPT